MSPTAARTLLIVVALLAPALAAAAPSDSCEVKATGGLTIDAKGAGRTSSFGSDYWLTEDELRTALRALSGIGQQLSDEEKAKKVEAQMKEDPRFILFLLNCETDAVTITLGPSGSSKYKDVPMKAATYPIAAAMKNKPGDVTLMLNVKNNQGFWRAQPGGKLTITAWDKKHIAGTFEFTATPGLGKDKGGTPALFSGSFDFPCRSSRACEK